MTVSGFACWGIEFVTAALDLSFCSWACVPASDLHVGIVDLSPQDWTCQLEAVLNIKLGMCLDLHVGTLDFSVQHWICHFEARPSARPMSTRMLVSFEASGGGRAPKGGAQDLLRWTSI